MAKRARVGAPEIYRRQKTPLDAEMPMYQMAYDEAKRAVDDQIAELDSIRQRSVQFLAFVGTATAFLVGTSIGPRSSAVRDAWFYGIASAASVGSLALVLLVLVILRGVAVVPPEAETGVRRRLALITWEFRLRPTLLMEWLDASIKPDTPQFTQALVELYEEMGDWNERWLEWIRKYYAWFIALGVVQLALWGALAWHNG